MNKLLLFVILLIGVSFMSAEDKYNKLNDLEKFVIEDKGTEHPFTGIYNDFDEEGMYKCKRCGEPLFKSDDKFHSG